MFDLKGTRVVITGAGGGVGRALCPAFAAAGAQVLACDVPGAVLPDTVQSFAFDLRDQLAITAAAESILADGPPQIVILNAGGTRAETLAGVTAKTLADEMDRNFTGTAILAQALLPAMRRQTGNRAFVSVGSVNALAHFGNPAYSAAKAALLSWMRAIAVEEGRHGIRANAVIPASIRTNAWEARLAEDPGILDRLAQLFPLGRIVTPQEVANAVLFLASPLASGITGTTLAVDAGLMAGNLPFLDAITSLQG